MILLIFLNVLSDKDEFIIGLRGLNNTILSFDLDDKKIEFFHKKKYLSSWSWFSILIWTILFIIMCLIAYAKDTRY